jgi:hypothetical protein
MAELRSLFFEGHARDEIVDALFDGHVGVEVGSFGWSLLGSRRQCRHNQEAKSGCKDCPAFPDRGMNSLAVLLGMHGRRIPLLKFSKLSLRLAKRASGCALLRLSI